MNEYIYWSIINIINIDFIIELLKVDNYFVIITLDNFNVDKMS